MKIQKNMWTSIRYSQIVRKARLNKTGQDIMNSTNNNQKMWSNKQQPKQTNVVQPT